MSISRISLSRRTLLRAAPAGLLTLFSGGSRPPLAMADDPPPETEAARSHVTPETQRAIDRGLEWLSRTQNADGSYGDRPNLTGSVAVTSLAGLALMAGGHQPGRGRLGQAVTQALRSVIGRENRGSSPGLLTNPGAPPQHAMYNHGFATLFLAEAHGMVGDRELRAQLRGCLERAVQLIVGAQNREGGWRYDPVPNQADVSVTICQIMALRSAKNAGLAVPKGVRDKCLDYVKACQNADGGFSYFKLGAGQGSASAFARSAAGVCALHSAGIYTGVEVERGLRFLMTYKPPSMGYRRFDPPEMHYYYGHYYAAQAMWTAGGRFWEEWFPAVRDELLSRARNARAGVWADPVHGDHYATAMACIILQIPNNYLPILQK